MVNLQSLVLQTAKEVGEAVAEVRKQLSASATSGSDGSSLTHHNLKKTLRKLERLQAALVDFRGTP